MCDPDYVEMCLHGIYCYNEKGADINSLQTILPRTRTLPRIRIIVKCQGKSGGNGFMQQKTAKKRTPT